MYDHGSMQLNFRPSDAKKFTDMANEIPDADLYVGDDPVHYGRETEPHVTVLYGLNEYKPADIAELASHRRPIRIKLGKVSKFEQPGYDVLKVDVKSGPLHNLHNTIKDNTDNVYSYDGYSPHVTIAYVEKGKGDDWLDDDRFEDSEFTFDQLTLNSKSGQKTKIPFTGLRAIPMKRFKKLAAELAAPKVKPTITYDQFLRKYPNSSAARGGVILPAAKSPALKPATQVSKPLPTTQHKSPAWTQDDLDKLVIDSLWNAENDIKKGYNAQANTWDTYWDKHAGGGGSWAVGPGINVPAKGTYTQAQVDAMVRKSLPEYRQRAQKRYPKFSQLTPAQQQFLANGMYLGVEHPSFYNAAISGQPVEQHMTYVNDRREGIEQALYRAIKKLTSGTN